MVTLNYDNYIILNHDKDLVLLIIIMGINTHIYSQMVVHGQEEHLLSPVSTLVKGG